MKGCPIIFFIGLKPSFIYYSFIPDLSDWMPLVKAGAIHKWFAFTCRDLKVAVYLPTQIGALTQSHPMLQSLRDSNT